MRILLVYTKPPEREPMPIPKFEVFIDFKMYTWYCIIESTDTEYDGTFDINNLTGGVIIGWYQMCNNTNQWEAVEEELRSTIILESR